MERYDLINYIIKQNSFTNYLEIGIQNPINCFDKVIAKNKTSVDPGLDVEKNLAEYKIPSDEFFDKLNKGETKLPKDYKWDVVFIDGLHLAPQVERDILNSLEHLSEDGYIFIHDCNPFMYEYNHRRLIEDNLGGAWNGTVWKALYKFYCTRADLDVVTVNIDEGVGVIKKNTQPRELPEFENPYFEYLLLSKNPEKYLNIVNFDEFKELFKKKLPSSKPSLYNMKKKPLKKQNIPSTKFNYNFLDGAFMEILSEKERNYKVIFTDLNTNEIVHQDALKNNMWSKTARKYFTEWGIEVFDLDTKKLVFEHKFNAKNRRVYIHLDSKAIGDTLAWFPYVEEFRKKHECKVIVSTFHNNWFEDQYPELDFVKPGTPVHNLYAMYSVGWYYKGELDEINYDKIPIDFRKYPLQQTSSESLGLEYVEIKPKLSFDTNNPTKLNKKYVCIAPHASAHAKYWNYPGGWQKIIDYLKSKDYEIVYISQESLNDNWHNSKLGGKLNNIIDKSGDHSLQNRTNDLLGCEFFIGVGSGLSWLSWALGVKTILISGFSSPETEFEDCERIFTPDPKLNCNSCFNKQRLNAGDWEWCPEHKNTPRMFECTKTITPLMIKDKINKLIK